jgi:hypothetical protein
VHDRPRRPLCNLDTVPVGTTATITLAAPSRPTTHAAYAEQYRDGGVDVS